MWPLLEPAIECNVPFKDKMTYFYLISHVHNLHLEDPDEIEFISEKVQELIALPETRDEGLFLLEAALQKSSIYIHNWGNIVQGCLKSSDSSISKELTLKILKQVVRNFGDNSNYLVSFEKFLPGIILLLLKSEKDQEFDQCCQSLTLCMRKFPQITGFYMIKIEEFLMANMDSLSTCTIEAIADCFSALPHCLIYFQKPRPILVDAWDSVFMKAFNTLHSLLNKILFFPDVETSFVNIDSCEVYEIPTNTDEFSSTLSQIRAFASLCGCLAKMISTETTRVQVPVIDLLQCLERIFQTSAVVKINTPKCSVFLLAFPMMLNAVYVVLEAIILNFSLIEQGSNFVNLLLKSLEATNHILFSLSSTSQIRCATWKIINIWIHQYGAKGAFELATEESILEELIKDIHFYYANEDNGFQNGIKEDANQIFASIEALRALNSIILTGGSFANKKCLEIISVTALKLIRRLQLNFHPRNSFPLPYSNEKCRKELYNLLLTSCIHEDSLQIKHINQAVPLFKIALKDPSVKVTKVCHKAFKLCRYFLNPKKPPPDYVIYSTPEIIGRVPLPAAAEEENVQNDWGNISTWNVSQSNGDIESSIQVENVYHNTSTDKDDIHSIQQEVNYSQHSDSQCNGDYKTYSKLSSHSGDSESECMEEDRSFGDEEMNPEIVFAESTYIPVKANRPHITILEPAEVQVSDTRTDVNSCDAVERVDQNCVEIVGEASPRKTPVSEISEEEESEDDDEDEEEEDIEEEEEGMIEDVEEVEEPPQKMLKVMEDEEEEEMIEETEVEECPQKILKVMEEEKMIEETEDQSQKILEVKELEDVEENTCNKNSNEFEEKRVNHIHKEDIDIRSEDHDILEEVKNIRERISDIREKVNDICKEVNDICEVNIIHEEDNDIHEEDSGIREVDNGIREEFNDICKEGNIHEEDIEKPCIKEHARSEESEEEVDEVGVKSPTITEMCLDFVLAEPTEIVS